MLKVVGASWLQTRISTYILVAVVILGIGAIVLSQFRVDNDGTYSATVRWNHRGGFKIEFWGQGNDLDALPMGAARAYYKTRIHEIGWSMVEIETSENYPDTVQAHAAGLLEGSLTWQLIHHHWHNTIAAACAREQLACEVIRQKLRGNALRAKNQARDLEADDPFWHMLKLFYVQLEGLEAGWRSAVFRSRKSVDIPTEDFIWLAVASDLPSFRQTRGENTAAGVIFLKNITSEMSEPLLAILHNTVAPYSKMLRLLKKYTFGYHMTEAKNAERVPTRSIVSSSYPGALSSQDEYYVLHGEKKEDLMVLAGTSLLSEPTRESRHDNFADNTVSVMSYESHTAMAAPKIMAANWLASDAPSWSRSLARRDGPDDTGKALQWVIVRANDSSVWLVEQRLAETHVFEYTQVFRQKGRLLCDGNPLIQSQEKYLRVAGMESISEESHQTPSDKESRTSTENNEESHVSTTSTPSVQVDLRMNNHEPQISSMKNNSDLHNFTSKLLSDEPALRKIMSFRGDLEDVPSAIGVVDSKVSLINIQGLSRFEATSGPVWSEDTAAFEWSVSFPKKPHIGHPDKFNFKSMVPLWVWI